MEKDILCYVHVVNTKCFILSARVKLVLVGLKMSSKWPLQFAVITLPTNRSKVVTTVSLGLAILGLITAYFRLRKKCSQNVKRQVPDGSEHNSRLHSYLNGGLFYL